MSASAVAFAAENPAPDISAGRREPGAGHHQVPDFDRPAALDAGREDSSGPASSTCGQPHGGGSHVQLAFLFRQIRGESQPNATLSTGGAGFHFSGRIHPPWRGERNRILFAIAGGWGIGRYITDLGTLGGQDAVFDPATNTLEPLPVG